MQIEHNRSGKSEPRGAVTSMALGFGCLLVMLYFGSGEGFHGLRLLESGAGKLCLKNTRQRLRNDSSALTNNKNQYRKVYQVQSHVNFSPWEDGGGYRSVSYCLPHLGQSTYNRLLPPFLCTCIQ